EVHGRFNSARVIYRSVQAGRWLPFCQMIMKDRVIKSLSSNYPMAKQYWSLIILIWHHASRIFKKVIGSSSLVNMNIAKKVGSFTGLIMTQPKNMWVAG